MDRLDCEESRKVKFSNYGSPKFFLNLRDRQTRTDSREEADRDRQEETDRQTDTGRHGQADMDRQTWTRRQREADMHTVVENKGFKVVKMRDPK